MSRRKKYNGPRFAALYDWEMKLPAYRLMSVYGRALLMEFRMAYTGHNNGEIVMSIRQAAELLNCNKDTAAKYLAELEEKGWIHQTSKGSFSQKTDKTASTWRITNQPIGLGVDTPETKEYAHWKPGVKIQNTVPLDRTVCPTTSDREAPKTPPHGPTTSDTYISTIRGVAQSGERR